MRVGEVGDALVILRLRMVWGSRRQIRGIRGDFLENGM